VENGPILRGKRVVLRPVTGGDVPAITALLLDPTVARWWGAYDEAKVQDEFVDDVEDGTKFIVEVDGAFAGIIQYGEELDPMYRRASIDLALGGPFQGRSIGPVPSAPSHATFLESAATIASPSTRQPKTGTPSARMRELASAGSGLCDSTNAAWTAPGTTVC